LFRLSPSVAETPLPATFHYFFFSDAKTPLFSTVDFFFPDAETPLFNTFYSSHSQNTTVHHFLTILHQRNNTVQQLFLLSFSLLKHHCQQPFIIFSDVETPLFSTFDFFPILKHHCSALSTFSRC
jgi:hypothetical protein